MRLFGRAGWIAISAAGFARQVLSQNLLSASGVSNCASNASIKVSYANISFDRSSGSLTFNVSGSSTEEQRVKASLTVSAYGVQVYQNEFDPCSASTNVTELCPVPKGDFSAHGSQAIPLQYLSQVPSIAFSIPDLDGNITMKLVSAHDGGEVGCLQSGVSNGKTLQMPAIANVAAGVAVAALILSGVSSLLSAGAVGAPGSSIGFATILGWFQTISTTGMMSVNYPSVYRSFSKNFAFSTGLIPITAVETRIDAFRNATGGNLTNDSTAYLQKATLDFTDGSSSAVPLSGRGFSERLAGMGFGARAISLSTSADTNASSAAGGNSTFTHDVYGIGAFAEELMIPQANIFLTALLIFAIVVASITAGILLFKVVLEVWAQFGTLPKKLASSRRRYWTLLAKTIANLILVVYGIWVAWSIFQFTVGDSTAARVLAAVSLALFTAVLGGFAARIVVLARRSAAATGAAAAGLYDHKETWVRYGVFYESYRRQAWWAFMPAVGLAFGRGAVLAAGNGHGLAQTVAQLALELLGLLFLAVARPFATRGANALNGGIQAVRVLSFGCVLVFVEELGVAQTTRTVTGFVLVVVQAALSGLLVVLLAVAALVAVCRQSPHRRNRRRAGAADEMAGRRDTLTSLGTRNSLLARSAERGRDTSGGAGEEREMLGAGAGAGVLTWGELQQQQQHQQQLEYRQGLPSYGSAARTTYGPGDQLAANAAALGHSRPYTRRSEHSYDEFAYRQPTLPMV